MYYNYMYNVLLYIYSNLISILVSQVFKDIDFLGWYTTGDSATETDLKVHQQVYLALYDAFLYNWRISYR